MTKNNSVKDMVSALRQMGPMTENEITKAVYDYDRNYHGTVLGESNKKYADMLRRGMQKGLIGRAELSGDTRAKFAYYATKEIEVPCSAELDNEWANESI